MGVEVGLDEQPIATGERNHQGDWWLHNWDMRGHSPILAIPNIIPLLLTDIPNVPWMTITEIEEGLNKYSVEKAIVCTDEKLDLNYPNIQFSHADYGRFPLYFTCSNIFLHSNEGDIIFDPFAGYGTTGICALDMHRRFIGIEINPEIYRIALGNLESVEQKTFVWQ